MKLRHTNRRCIDTHTHTFVAIYTTNRLVVFESHANANFPDTPPLFNPKFEDLSLALDRWSFANQEL